MNPLVIAVDTGNKNIKTPHTEPFNSGLICHGAIPPAVKSDTLLFDGNYYTLTQSRIPYMYNKNDGLVLLRSDSHCDCQRDDGDGICTSWPEAGQAGCVSCDGPSSDSHSRPCFGVR